MRAVIYHQHDDVRVEEVPVPAIGAGELLLRVAGCGLCGSDILKLTSDSTSGSPRRRTSRRHALQPRVRAPGPAALGHELTGTVAASQTPRFAPGQRVVVAHHVPCGACAYCRRGSPTMCAQFKTSNLDPCGLAEYVRVSAAHATHTTFALPTDLSDEAASFTEPLACCLRALGRAALASVEDAVIVGLGAMGLLMLQALRARLPAAHIRGVDPLAPRRALACELGAADAYDPSDSDPDLAERVRDLTSGRGADLVILTVGAPAALATAQRLVRDGGEILVFAAQPGAPVPFDLWDCYHRELRLTTSYSSTPADLAAALNLLAAGHVRTEHLISHRLPLADFHQGVALVRAHQALKVYFDMSLDTSMQTAPDSGPDTDERL